MGKKAKIGKFRKDKFYKLAKETGFRSRAAFKLIQLNRRFEFLQESQVCIDLCAAPGGWMQVAKQNMPVSSIVIGVDLFPIKSIPGCIGLVEDITTEKCRAALSRELKTWKADVILHDGAPNVGKNWLYDAYQQICLTLNALKLATGFLRGGGWFVTKVFRSKDYNALLWVLKQLFRKVHATKPSASRKESAEIFVVCQHYIAPDKIDPRFLDSKYVFEELELEGKGKTGILAMTNQKRIKADGYSEIDFLQRNRLAVSEFVAHANGVGALQGISEIIFDDDRMLNHPKTTEEIRTCCKDIKVLGRKDLRGLLNWWKALKTDFTVKEVPAIESDDEGKEGAPEPTEEDIEDREVSEMEKQIALVELEESRDAKRLKKRASKLRAKLNEKLNLKMVLKGDEGPHEEAEEGIFTLRNIRTEKQIDSLLDQTADMVAYSDGEDPDTFKPKFMRYQRESDRNDGGNYAGYGDEDSDSVSESESDLGREGLGLSDDSGDDAAANSDLDDRRKPMDAAKAIPKSKRKETNPLLNDLDHRNKDAKRQQRVQLWFEKDTIKNVDNDEDEDLDLDKLTEEYKHKGVKVLGESTEPAVQMPLGKKAKRRARHRAEGSVSSANSSSSDDDDDNHAHSATPQNDNYNVDDHYQGAGGNKQQHRTVKKIGGSDGFEVAAKEQNPIKKQKLSDEELALGTLLATSVKSRRDIMDSAWHRFAFNDQNLPDWFVADEEQHMRKDLPVPEDLVADYAKRVEEMNVRPIKKVMEAKARKKRRTAKRMKKASKKAEAILENQDASAQEKTRQLKKIYKKAEDKKKEVTYVVAKKHLAAKRSKRPSGVKGKYRVVDPRLKKDKRPARTAAKKSSSSGGGGRGKKRK